MSKEFDQIKESSCEILSSQRIQKTGAGQVLPIQIAVN